MSFSIHFLESLNNNESFGMRGDLIYMDKDDEEVALGCDLYGTPDPNEFRISKDKFVLVLEKWIKLYKDPEINEITLIYDEDAEDNKKVLLSGRFMNDVDKKSKNKP